MEVCLCSSKEADPLKNIVKDNGLMSSNGTELNNNGFSANIIKFKKRITDSVRNPLL